MRSYKYEYWSGSEYKLCVVCAFNSWGNNNHLFVSRRLSEFSLISLDIMRQCSSAPPNWKKNEFHADSQSETRAQSLNTIKERLQERICNFFSSSFSFFVSFFWGRQQSRPWTFNETKAIQTVHEFIWGVRIVWRACINKLCFRFKVMAFMRIQFKPPHSHKSAFLSLFVFV